MSERILVVGSGTRFLSGISYYTWHLSSALAERHQVSVILMRRLLPARLYPGRDRVGATLTPLRYDGFARSFDGVDWFWLPSMIRAVRFLRAERPDVVVFQWWTAAVGHSYVALAWAARRRGAEVVIELHETQDTGEARMKPVATYGRWILRRLLARASGVVVHSSFDREQVEGFAPPHVPLAVIPHGPYDHHAPTPGVARRDAPDDAWNILYFGTIRPYKGLEHAVEAFDRLPDDVAARSWLTVVGETWEGWDRPLELLAASARRDRTTVVNRYVDDDELTGWLAGADLVVLPYLRSSASGPLHTVMHAGLPVIVTAVGGLIEAAEGYDGATLVPPGDPDAIAAAIEQVVGGGDKDTRFDDPQSWERTAERYDALMATMAERR